VAKEISITQNTPCRIHFTFDHIWR